MDLYPSLKSRYAKISIFLAIVIIASAAIGHKFVISSHNDAATNETHRSEMQATSRLLRNKIWLSREWLEEFLLEPHIDQMPEQIREELNKAQDLTQQLKQKTPQDNTKLIDILSGLESELKQLLLYVDEVIDTRLDATKQYPALALASGTMQPNQTTFYLATDMAMNEILEDETDGYKSEVYQTFSQVRQLWGRMISNFRMYLSNRLGSYSEEVLPLQEQDTQLLVDEIREKLKIIQSYEDEGTLGFIGSESLLEMQNAFANWDKAYKQVLIIHHTGTWRTDKQILLNYIKPHYLDIWASLDAFDTLFKELASKDINHLEKISTIQLKMVWITSIIGLIIIVFGYFILNKSLLVPIASLTTALKDESEGKRRGSLPAVNALETQNLLHAFKKMQTQIQARENDLKHQAMHDDLTGLPNRNLIGERLKHIIAIARREGRHPALLMMDLNGFKQVNDTLGHQMGDKLLLAISNRLRELLRESDTIARLGGDEFALLIDHTELEDAVDVANRILAIIQKPFTIEHNQLYVSASIGIAHYPMHGETDELLLQHADVAMYHAKNNKLGITIYDMAIDENEVQKLSMVLDLRSALENDELELYFQPKTHISNGKTIGVESLLRWNHPKNGFIPPDEIISLAEQSGLINHIFEWVFSKAAIQVRRWIDIGLNLNVSVNLSVYDFQHHDIISVISSTLEKNNLSPQCFTLEITEGAMMENPENAIEKLTAVDQMGLRISIDDFGTGYSSLSYLKKLPVDELKIDKSFVMQMHEDENDEIIVRSTIDLAHNLGLEVVAEGVENQKIYELLESYGCDILQGFHMAPAMPVADFEAWIVKHDKLTLPVKNIKNA